MDFFFFGACFFGGCRAAAAAVEAVVLEETVPSREEALLPAERLSRSLGGLAGAMAEGEARP